MFIATTNQKTHRYTYNKKRERNANITLKIVIKSQENKRRR